MRTTHTHTKSAGRPGDGARGPARTPRAASDPVESLGLLLHGLAKEWREAMDRRLRPLGLTRVQWQALLWLSRAGGELMQGELGDMLEIGAPATVALVDRMERDGLVTRHAVPGDRRRNAVMLTPQAGRLLKAIQDVASELRHEVKGGLTGDELRTLCALLAKARQRIEGLNR